MRVAEAVRIPGNVVNQFLEAPALFWESAVLSSGSVLVEFCKSSPFAATPSAIKHPSGRVNLSILLHCRTFESIIGNGYSLVTTASSYSHLPGEWLECPAVKWCSWEEIKRY